MCIVPVVSFENGKHETDNILPVPRGLVKPLPRLRFQRNRRIEDLIHLTTFYVAQNIFTTFYQNLP